MMKKINLLLIISIIIIEGGFAANAKATIALLGDSMTWIGGENCDKECGWTSHFKSEVDSLYSIDMYARSGATWTNTSKTSGNTRAYSEIIDDENVIYTQVLRLIEDADRDAGKIPDVILIYAGANDAWFASRRPNIFNTDVRFSGKYSPAECTSLSSSIDLSCIRLKEAFPNSRIMLMTPVEMTKTGVSQIRRVSDIIEECGKELNLEVLRADRNIPIRRDDEMKHFKYTTDGVHTNAAGATLIANFILQNLANKK